MPRSFLAKPLGETQLVSGLTTGVMTVDKVTLRQSLNQNQVVCKGIIEVALVCISWESGPRGEKVSSRWWRVLWIYIRKGSKVMPQWWRSLEAFEGSVIESETGPLLLAYFHSPLNSLLVKRFYFYIFCCCSL